MARLLLDTHLVLWWLADDPRLPAALVPLVRDPANRVFVSQCSLWEIAIKQGLGRLSVDLIRLEQAIPQQGFRWLVLRNAHLLAVAELEAVPGHRDPFDRLLIAQSRQEPCCSLPSTTNWPPTGQRFAPSEQRLCLWVKARHGEQEPPDGTATSQLSRNRTKLIPVLAPAMQVNLHDAKTHLSRYVAQALDGQEVVIAKAGRPLVRLVPVETTPEARRGGFLQGSAVVRADLKADFTGEIDDLFR